MTNERTTITVRMDTDLHDWLMDHRDSDNRSISDVIREVIDFWEQCQNDDHLSGSHTGNKYTDGIKMQREYQETHNKMLTSAKYHDLFESSKWIELIPAFNLKPDWLIQITPPVTGAIIRFRISKEGFRHNQDISVYLDCYDVLGIFGSPYWEAYPVNGDVWRCAMDDVDGLMEGIERGLQQIEEENNGLPDTEDKNRNDD